MSQIPPTAEMPTTACHENGPRYVRVSRFALLTGYTEKAVYHKIADGVWLERREYRRAPDGNICIDLKGYERWVEGVRAPGSSL